MCGAAVSYVETEDLEMFLHLYGTSEMYFFLFFFFFFFFFFFLLLGLGS
jgi:hypothetical protein